MGEAPVTPIVFHERDTDTAAHAHLTGTWLHAARALWAVLAILTFAAFVAAVPVAHQVFFDQGPQYADALVQLGITPFTFAVLRMVRDLLMALVFFVVGVFLFWHRSDNWMTIFVSLMLIMFGAIVANGIPLMQFGVGTAWARMVMALFGIGHSLFIVFLMIFPDGRFVPRWTAAASVFWSAWYVLSGFLPYEPFSVFKLPGSSMYFVMLASYLTGVVSQNIREKQYTRAQAQQVKWVSFGLFSALIGYLVLFLPRIFFPALTEPTVAGVIYELAASGISLIAMSMIPVSIVFSALHYRLWEVDFVINRSLVYGGLTFLLGIFFVLDVLIIQWLAQRITGQDQVPLAFAISAVLVGATFQPTRQRVQRLIDQQLYGINVDYRRGNTPGLAVGALVGTKIGPYEVQESIGRGGMAEVYRGIHPTLGRPVAIKILPPRLAAEADFRTRFEREAQTIAGLRHPNIVQIYDFGVADGLHYMVMEYIAGEDLGARIRRIGRMTPLEVLHIGCDIASALDHAHQQGIVHRDVKPSNVMMQPGTMSGGEQSAERAILTDFGIAKLVTGSTGLTKTGMMGTLDYIAPEQIRASNEVDGRADLYALGVMIYQMLTGKLPFEADNPGAVLIAHSSQPPTRA